VIEAPRVSPVGREAEADDDAVDEDDADDDRAGGASGGRQATPRVVSATRARPKTGTAGHRATSSCTRKGL